MKRWSVANVLAVLIPIVCVACAAPGKVAESESWQDEVPIYLIRHGWHTGIAIRSADISIAIWPEALDFPQAQYLEVGWGEADFYQARRFDLLLALKAALLPNPSVLHVAGMPGPVQDFFVGEEIVELRVSRDGLRGLVRYIYDSYERPAGGRTTAIGPGLYEDSRFYPARGHFYLFNTCNSWTVSALRAAGLVVPGFAAASSSQLMAWGRSHGSVVRAAERSGQAEDAMLPVCAIAFTLPPPDCNVITSTS
jgi:uncharacterized protein (TIGR02117 family)